MLGRCVGDRVSTDSFALGAELKVGPDVGTEDGADDGEELGAKER